MKKDFLLPLDEIEVMEGELLMVHGGFSSSVNVGAGEGCGCGCTTGEGCGCGKANGQGCGCNCTNGLGCGCGCVNPTPPPSRPVDSNCGTT